MTVMYLQITLRETDIPSQIVDFLLTHVIPYEEVPEEETEKKLTEGEYRIFCAARGRR